MELKSKKVVFLGDSITEGKCIANPDDIYHAVFARMTESTAVAYGIGGTRIAKQKVPSTDNPRHDLDFIGRVDAMDADADVVVVFGGTNDFGHGTAPMGSIDSRDPYTFYGAMHTLCMLLIEKYPDAQLCFMTPLHREGDTVPKKGKPWILEAYITAIKDVTRYYAIPTLDLHAVSGIQPNYPTIHARYTADGLHPNEAGHVKIAEKLAGFLKSL